MRNFYVVCVTALVAALIAATAIAQQQAPGNPMQQPVDIEAEDVDVVEALRVLSQLTGANIIIGEGVQGQRLPLVKLQGVTVETALQMLCEAAGLYWYRDGDVFVVSAKPPAEAKPEQPAQRGATPAPVRPSMGVPAQPKPEGGGAALPPALSGPGPAVRSGQKSEVIPPPPVAGESRVDTRQQRRGERETVELIPLKYADAAEIALMFGGSVVGTARTTSLTVPTLAASRRRAFAVASDSANILAGLGATSNVPPWRQWRGVGNIGARGAGGLGYVGGLGGRGRYGYGGGYGGRLGGYGGRYGYGGIGGGYGLGGIFTPPGQMSPPVAYMPQNALLVRGLPEEIDQFREIVALLDQPARQVEVAVKFVQVTVASEKAWGIDWTVTNGQLEVFNLGFAPAEATNNVVRFSRGRFEALLSAIQTSGRATVIASPIVTTQQNLPAEIDFYTEIPYFAATVTYNEFGQREVDYTTDYVYVDNMLSVTPRINGDDSVTMEVYPEIDQQVGTVEGPNGERVPITANWYIYVPQVTVADGETLVIGGMINKTVDEQLRETPLLSEIPLIGDLFKSRRRTINNSEVLIFVTPRIVRPLPRE